MTRKRKAQPAVPAQVGPSIAAGTTALPSRLIEIDALAALAVLLCLVLGYATRNNLNPDGVSYLDLSAAATRGDWAAFVQGYWSPLYPLLLAALAAVTSTDRVGFLPAVHMLNAIIACSGVITIWWWGQRRRDRIFTRAAMVAFVLAAARPLRIEAVTPDMLLLVLMAWVAYELIEHRGERWVRLGVLLGLAYLTKTSLWPWLVLATIVRLGFAWRCGPSRRAVIGAAAIAGLTMTPWIAAMSLERRQPTLSSAGELNLCWYLRACDGRTPDTHHGDHVTYAAAPLTNGTMVTVAQLDADTSWTYLPWSDPTAWADGVVSQARVTPTLPLYLRFWGRHAYYVITAWMMPVLVVVLLPFVIVHWPGRDAMRARGRRSDLLAVGLLGVGGIGQFVAVHAEPRLIAPFVLLVALSVIVWCRDTAMPDVAVSPTHYWWRQAVTAATVMIGIGLAAARVSGELNASALVDQRYLAIEAQLATEHPDGARRVAVVGYAVPALSDVWRSSARIVKQVPPRSAVEIGKLSDEQQVAEVRRLVGTTADVAWMINPDGRFRWVTIERADTSSSR